MKVKVLVTLDTSTLVALDKLAGGRKRSEWIEQLVRQSLERMSEPDAEAVVKRAPDGEPGAAATNATQAWLKEKVDAISAVPLPPSGFSQARKPVGSIRRIMARDPKSNAPVMVRKETLVRYDGEQEVWE